MLNVLFRVMISMCLLLESAGIERERERERERKCPLSCWLVCLASSKEEAEGENVCSVMLTGSSCC